LGVLADTQRLAQQAKAAVLSCLSPTRRKALLRSPELLRWRIEMAKWPYNTAAWKQGLADKCAGKNPPLPAET
jgi:hypothetical protein